MKFVRMFKPQFADLVASGAKLQTVRPTPKRMPKPSDEISLRTWTGLPYRSKQRILREAVISKIIPIEIRVSSIQIGCRTLTLDEEWEFARADGFRTPQEMLEWFAFQHGLPFTGIVIYWDSLPATAKTR